MQSQRVQLQIYWISPKTVTLGGGAGVQVAHKPSLFALFDLA
jgi:hypothetical protein